MRILHVLDHSIPLHSGYAFRTLSIPQMRIGKKEATRVCDEMHQFGDRQRGCPLRISQYRNCFFGVLPVSLQVFAQQAKAAMDVGLRGADGLVKDLRRFGV